MTSTTAQRSIRLLGKKTLELDRISAASGEIFYDNLTQTLRLYDGTTAGGKVIGRSEIPAQTGNTGKYLTTNGTSVSWANVTTLPSQTNNTGKFLTTNGTTASWAVPGQSATQGPLIDNGNWVPGQYGLGAAIAEPNTPSIPNDVLIIFNASNLSPTLSSAIANSGAGTTIDVVLASNSQALTITLTSSFNSTTVPTYWTATGTASVPFSGSPQELSSAQFTILDGYALSSSVTSQIAASVAPVQTALTNLISLNVATETLSVGVGTSYNQYTTQGATSIGYNAKGINNAVAVGRQAGTLENSKATVAVGYYAGSTAGDYAINIGHRTGGSAGGVTPANRTIAIGDRAGAIDQGAYSIAIGYAAGNGYGSNTAVSYTLYNDYTIGYITTTTGVLQISNATGFQEEWCIGMKVVITGTKSGTGSISGYTSGTTYYIIDIPDYNKIQLSTTRGGAGVTSVVGTIYGVTVTLSGNVQAANTIILNASGQVLEGVAAQTNSFYVDPIRNSNSPSNILYYNTTTKEITYGTASTPTIDTLVPSQTGNIGKILTTSGTAVSWVSPNSSRLKLMTSANGLVSHTFSDGPVWRHTSISANFTANFNGVPATEGTVLTVILQLVQGATPYMPTAVSIEGAGAGSILWQGAVSTGNANKTNVVTFTLIRSASTWAVLGEVKSYG